MLVQPWQRSKLLHVDVVSSLGALDMTMLASLPTACALLLKTATGATGLHHPWGRLDPGQPCSVHKLCQAAI